MDMGHFHFGKVYNPAVLNGPSMYPQDFAAKSLLNLFDLVYRYPLNTMELRRR